MSSGVVTLAGRPVFAWVGTDGSGLRLRVLSREWESLCLAEGQTVHVAGPGVSAGAMLIGSVRASGSGRTIVVLAPPIRL